MRRRTYLRGLGIAAAPLVAGCADPAGDSSPTTAPGTATGTPTPSPTTTATSSPSGTTTPTATPSPTPSPTPEPRRAPRIDDMGLVARWGTYGDLDTYRMDRAAAGTLATVIQRYHVDVRNGDHFLTNTYTVYDASGEQVTRTAATDRQAVDENGWQVWEAGYTFDTAGWGTGEFTVELVVRDEQAGLTSEPHTTTFTLGDELPTSAVEIEGVLAPESVATGEPFTYTIRPKNVGDVDGSFLTPLSITWESRDGWVTADEPLTFHLPAGMVVPWHSGEARLSEPESYTYRLDDLGYTWTVEGTE